MLNRSLILFSIVLLFVGCSKDADEETEVKDFTIEALAGKSWKLTTTDDNAAANPSGTNLYAAVLDCQKDDVLTFNASTSTCTTDFKQTICSGGTFNPATTNYSVDLTSRTLVLGSISYKIIELNARRLKIYVVITTSTGFNNVIYMFEHP